MGKRVQFEFYPQYEKIAKLKGVLAGDPRLDAMETVMNETTLGGRDTGNVSYHILYVKGKEFLVYWQGCDMSQMFSTKSLDEAIANINSLQP